ncbi:MAG: HEAT repeat domain-containing protein [Armatimonadota bacterium]
MMLTTVLFSGEAFAMKSFVKIITILVIAGIFFPMQLHAQNADAEVPRLLEKLKDPKPAARLAAVQSLEDYTDDARVVEPLIGALKDADPAVRKIAARNLGQTGDARAVEPLIMLLNDFNPNIRAEAINALGLIGDPRAVDALIGIVQAVPSLRKTAFQALGRIADPRMTVQLLPLLNEADAETRRTVAGMLASFGEERGTQALLVMAQDAQNADRVQSIITLSGLHDPHAVDLLLPLLRFNDLRVCGEAVEALGYTHDPRAVEPLLALLKKPKLQNLVVRTLVAFRDARAINNLSALAKAPVPNASVQIFAIDALGETRDPRAVPALIQALKNANSDLNPHARAIQALGRIGAASATEALLPFAQSTDNALRIPALEALGMIGDAKALNVLTIAATDKEEQVATLAVRALAKMNDPRAVKAVIHALMNGTVVLVEDDSIVQGLAHNPAATIDDYLLLMRGEHGTVQPALFAALGMVKIKDPRLLQAMMKWIAGGGEYFDFQDNRLPAAFTLYGTEAVDTLLTIVKSADTRNKFAVALLGNMGDARAIDVLKPLLADPKFGEEALFALARLKAVEVLPQLIASVKDPQEAKRQAAIQALGMLKDARALDVLIAALQEKGDEEAAESIRAHAAVALGEIGDVRATAPLLAALNEDTTFVRTAVAVALGKLPPDPRVVELLLPMLNDQKNQFSPLYAAQALARYEDERVVPVFLRAVTRGTLGTQVAIQVLGKRKDPRSTQYLLGCLLGDHDPQVQAAAATALGALNDPRAVPVLIRAVNDEDVGVRAAAVAALKTITNQDFGQDHQRWVAWWLKEAKSLYK